MIMQTIDRDSMGFTFVELMVTIVILGILAAVALPQYNAYRQRVRASKLIDIARACAQERAAHCQASEGKTPADANTLPNCVLNPGNLPGTLYAMTTVDEFSCAINVRTSAAIPDGGTTYIATCSGGWNGNINCSLVP